MRGERGGEAVKLGEAVEAVGVEEVGGTPQFTLAVFPTKLSTLHYTALYYSTTLHCTIL